MKSVLARLLAYVAFDTQSDDRSRQHPSTPGQWELALHLAEELKMLGADRVRISDHAYVFGELPASPGWETVPALGLIAHMDTSDAASGREVKPQVVVCQGECIPLGDGARVLDPAVFPQLARLAGHTLVTTDGTTLLGADDKAGIVEIMTAAERLIAEKIPHGRICIGFTPDEEIGEGALHFDVADFGAVYAYTVDGGAAGTIEYQNFNAALATVTIRGVSVHPGSAKGAMVNALKVAHAFDALLPPDEVPERTEQFQGFYHLARSSGTVGGVGMEYLLRDHDRAAFERRKEAMMRAAAQLNAMYGPGTVTVTLRDQYGNMEEIIRRHPYLIAAAETAVQAAGLVPSVVPIRGGTDGAMLSFRGLPCPNLGTGGYNFHGEWEFVSVPEMEATVEILLHLIAAMRDVPVSSGEARP